MRVRAFGGGIEGVGRTDKCAHSNGASSASQPNGSGHIHVGALARALGSAAGLSRPAGAAPMSVTSFFCKKFLLRKQRIASSLSKMFLLRKKEGRCTGPSLETVGRHAHFCLDRPTSTATHRICLTTHTVLLNCWYVFARFVEKNGAYLTAAQKALRRFKRSNVHHRRYRDSICCFFLSGSSRRCPCLQLYECKCPFAGTIREMHDGNTHWSSSHE